MKGSKKLLLLFTGILLMTAGIWLAIYGRNTIPPGKSYVALITKSTESAFWQSVYAGASAAATSATSSFASTTFTNVEGLTPSGSMYSPL